MLKEEHEFLRNNSADIFLNHCTLDFFLLPTGWSIFFFKELWTEEFLSDFTGVIREGSKRLSESDSISLKYKIFL